MPKSDWRKVMKAKVSALIKQAAPKAVEEYKYKMKTNPKGVPVWSQDGMICTVETFKEHMRLTFAKGPELKKHDPKGLINTYRAVLLREGDKLDAVAFKKIVRAAVAMNVAKKK